MKRLAPVVFAALLAFPGSVRADRAAAQAAISEGQAALQRRDLKAAGEAFTRAITEDRAWGAGWGWRGQTRYREQNFTAALEDLTIAIELDPGTRDWRMYRTQTYLYLDRITEALEDTEQLLKMVPDDRDIMSLRGRALVRSGDVDGGLALQQKAFDAGHDLLLPPRSDAFIRKADWEALAASASEAVAGGAPSTVLQFHRVIGFVELGQYDKAAAVVDEFEKSRGRTIVWWLCRVWLESTPGAGARFRPDDARTDVENLLVSTLPEALNTAARAFLLCGDAQRCVDTLTARARLSNFETLFWLGAAYWKLGKFPEARAVLSDARRLNPYLAKHGSRVEGIGDFLLGLDREMAPDRMMQQDRGRLGHELSTHLLTVAEIETLVRRYQFARAADEYTKLQPTLKSEVRRAEVAARLPEVRGMAGALAKLVAAINSGKLKLKTTVGGIELTLLKADAGAFDFSIPKGQGRFPWAFLGATAFCEFAVQAGLTPEETFGLGCLAWDAGERPVAAGLFGEALKKKSDLAKSLNAFIARRRGIPVPDAGFVAFRGSWVTKEEKANLEKGLVQFQGEWVTQADKEQLSKGNIKVDGKWLPGNEAELVRRGCRKQDGRWVSREEYEAFHSQWANAWTEESAHWAIRTNEGEAFAKDLAGLAEAAWPEFAKYHDAEAKLPGKDKLTLYAFRDYEDYRRYCVETKSEDYLGAAGFAKSDSTIAVGWNKTSNRQQFLQTMVHEAAHLYYSRCAPAAKPASWYAEAMATYFEGFEWDGKAWKFGAASEGRLPFVRSAMKEGTHIPLADLLGGEAIKLINTDPRKALLFYAECWSLNYYLCQTDNRAVRDAYTEYRKAVVAGRTDPLTKFFPDAAQLEKDWIRFVTGL